MLRLCTVGLLVFVVAAATDDTRREVLDEGDSHTISVITLGHTVDTCFVDTPNDGSLQFSPGDDTQSTAKYTILSEDAFVCMVTVNNINANDAGDWAIHYTHATGVGRTQPYHFTVTLKEPSENEDESSESDDADVDKVKDFTMIRHRTVQQAEIDISLNKESFEEECYIEPPNGELIKANEFVMDNVIVQPSSKYVSCRITISPVAQAALGEWRVCGKSTVNNEMRCQPVSIEYNRGSPQGTWDNWVHDMFRHPVHFGSSVNPGVLGNGDINTCHVITPAGEDLVITTEIKYPHIERSALGSTGLCSVVFTDIDSDMIGEWKLYGKFDSILGLNQVSLPLEFYLYNENNPYEQAYNVTVDESRHIVNLGTILTTSVSDTGSLVECMVTTPSGQLIDSHSTTDEIIFHAIGGLCQVSLGPLTETMLGEWLLVGKFNNGPLFSEQRLAFDIIREDPANPIQEDDRTIQYLPQQVFDTHMDASHRVVIETEFFHNSESCHIQTPDGLQYSFIDGFNVPNVEIIINEDGVECGVMVHVASTDMVGEWTLISRSIWLTSPIERRLPFSIIVEVNYTLPHNIVIREGSNLHLRLEDTISQGSTCELFGPDGEIYSNAEVDTIYADKCGFIVRGVTKEHNGTWAIRYGHVEMSRATVEVTVIGTESSPPYTAENQVWTLGSSLNQSMGPEDAVYCKIEDAQGLTVYEGFGKCVASLDRVNEYHQGWWTISVASPGTILMQEQRFYVTVRGAEQEPLITTSVTRVAPAVFLTCSLPPGHQIKACKFRDVKGDTMVVQHGVGDQNGYGAEISGQDCILRLNNPAVSDLGLWRCAIDTDDTTHYAFLTVTCPWLMSDPEVAAGVITEPVLAQEKHTISALEGDPTVLRCSIPASIRYCYFRASNGAVYNVGPAISSPDYEYVGSGLHSGECGIRFHSMVSTVGAHGGDGRQWSCHVGLMDTTAPEQSVSMSVEVKEKLTVTHHYDAYNRLVIEAAVYDSHPLDYCRFVRINGQGFHQFNVPEGFVIDVYNGHCALYIDNPNILDIHPWTVVAKLTGVEAEISKYTTLSMGGGDGGQEIPVAGPNVGMICLWVFIGLLGVVLLGFGFAMISKKNRERTACRFRNSFRRNPAPAPMPVPAPQRTSIFKEPLADPPTYQETA